MADHEISSDGSPEAERNLRDLGAALGAGTCLAPMRRGGARAGLDLSGEDRILALLAAAHLQPIDPLFPAKLGRASELWARGEKSLAHIHVIHCGLPALESEEQAFRLFLADGLIAEGYPPAALCKALGFDLPRGLRKYSPDQPRDDHGRWTAGAGSSGGSAVAGPPLVSDNMLEGRSANTNSQTASDSTSSTSASAVEAPIAGASETEGAILGELSAEALAGLEAVAAGVAGAAAVFGLIFIPSPKNGVVSQGLLPGQPGLAYSADHDEGVLRISRTSPVDDKIVATARLGADGLFRDEDGAPIARAVGADIVIDPDALHAATGAETSTDANRNEPKLCPDPSAENVNGREAFDVQYEQYIRSLVNPQRQPPLPPGLAFSLVNPATGRPVVFDDCRDSDGAMIEAKGHYEDMLASEFGERVLEKDWTNQAKRQILASGGRTVEWYFHEQAAADFARDLFEGDEILKRIIINVEPDPSGVPNPNPRIK